MWFHDSGRSCICICIVSVQIVTSCLVKHWDKTHKLCLSLCLLSELSAIINCAKIIIYLATWSLCRNGGGFRKDRMMTRGFMSLIGPRDSRCKSSQKVGVLKRKLNRYMLVCCWIRVKLQQGLILWAYALHIGHENSLNRYSVQLCLVGYFKKLADFPSQHVLPC